MMQRKTKAGARTITSGLVVALLAGCATTATYTPPSDGEKVRTTIVIDKPKAEAWDALIAQIGKSFFVVNNLDRSSGFVNVSYNGDPQSYVDCGWVSYSTPGAGGTPVLSGFPGSSPTAQYVIVRTNSQIHFRRKMDLDGRMNIVMQDAGPGRTSLTVNVRYGLTRTIDAFNNYGNQIGTKADTVTFNTNGAGIFPDNDGNPLRCRSKGSLEENVLQMVK